MLGDQNIRYATPSSTSGHLLNKSKQTIHKQITDTKELLGLLTTQVLRIVELGSDPVSGQGGDIGIEVCFALAVCVILNDVTKIIYIQSYSRISRAFLCLRAT